MTLKDLNETVDYLIQENTFELKRSMGNQALTSKLSGKDEAFRQVKALLGKTEARTNKKRE